ncbi:BON domain-containing protein [Rhizobium miluonense]|uniref:BON domain-containing protein n=1 Tax=Rhizobium miluonense TaxID=411945 RepID=A0A1C3XC42_9HYPH|nr:BON domain-containing protein [Rhizobium miluonense]SCB49867.1 BON domain-containing protein [Rhizobium miluonense]
MTEIKNSKEAKGSPDHGHIRTLQALDQAAGGSGQVVPERAEDASSAGIRPEHGTDDARCEDSAECDLQRKQMAEEVFFRISNVPRSEDIDESAKPGGESAGDFAPKQERTDAEIRLEIEGKLKTDQLLREASIFVTVSRGRVVIEGSVENHEARQRAEAISRQASGITGHDSNLAVRKSS